MNRRVLAFDYDGTIAEHGSVPMDLQEALRRLHAAGYVLFLATGRQFERVSLEPLSDILTGVVWENGAVLHHSVTSEIYLPFGTLDPRLVAALKSAGIPLEYGRAIVSTWTPYDETVWRIISEWGGDAAVVRNKGSVMVMPSGAAKGAGLDRLLTICGFSSRNLVTFGDGENDLSMFGLSEYGIAVADAVPALCDAADLVTAQPGPAGVLEVLTSYWLNGLVPDVPVRQERQIRLGQDADGEPVTIAGAVLAGGNLGVFGDSGSGKSWVTGLLAEGMHHAGYQVLLIDSEGDYRSLRGMPGIVVLEGDQNTLPPPGFTVALLETAAVSVVLDLCTYPVAQRIDYVANLFRKLRALRERKFRPHWIVLEEAQYFLSPGGGIAEDALRPMLADGGLAFVSYRPDRLAGSVLTSLKQFLLTRLGEPNALEALHRSLATPLHESLAELALGYALLCNKQLVRLRANGRRAAHVRHFFKYLDVPLPNAKRFFFRTEAGYLGVEAASLFEFLQCLNTLPLDCLEYHENRGDFIAWAAGALGDAHLAGHLRKLSHRRMHGEELRTALAQHVTDRYQELHDMR
jgi:hydroxymethylpyrimidine pyrophosphatase-like HAD family hydrolase